jgi:hypothetical protein
MAITPLRSARVFVRSIIAASFSRRLLWSAAGVVMIRGMPFRIYGLINVTSRSSPSSGAGTQAGPSQRDYYQQARGPRVVPSCINQVCLVSWWCSSRLRLPSCSHEFARCPCPGPSGQEPVLSLIRTLRKRCGDPCTTAPLPPCAVSPSLHYSRLPILSCSTSHTSRTSGSSGAFRPALHTDSVSSSLINRGCTP